MLERFASLRSTRIAPRRHARGVVPLLAGLVAMLQPLRAQVDDDLANLSHKKPAQLAALAKQLDEQVDARRNAWFDSLRARMVEAEAPGPARGDRLSGRAPKKPKGTPEAAALPGTVHYVFGVGAIEPTPKLAKASKDLRAQAATRARFETAALGILPGADLAVAALLRRLDADTGADRFAAFLEAWRNGDESFYEALDRTAGTPDSVFFYDAMLSDFVAQFVPKRGEEADKVRSGLAAAHDALHAAFLSYRQYRAFREAVALSLVLPPDRPLPAHLRRYEEKTAGTYSLREQVQMVLAVEGFDVAKVSDAIVRSAAPLPTPVWSVTYDPFPAWNAIFDARMPRMIEAAGNTDAHLARTRARLQDWAQELAGLAHAVLQKPKPRAVH